MKHSLLIVVDSFLLLLIFYYNAAGTDTQPAKVRDIDGNTYHTITLGTQTWIIENLKTTKYNDGASIPMVTSTIDWGKPSPGYCWYNNDSAANKKTYGALYNWYAVITGKLAPKGWHVPSAAEWDTLQNYLIAHRYNYDGTITGNKIAKALAAKENWHTISILSGQIGNDLSKNNKSGFSAQPGGYRSVAGCSEVFADFEGIGCLGYWWTTTFDSTSGASHCVLNFSNETFTIGGCKSQYGASHNRSCGMSVRLVKD
jgi:uncharacterized protein (TIGR02145 family)